MSGNPRYLSRLLALAITAVCGGLFFVDMVFYTYLFFRHFDMVERNVKTRDVMELAVSGLTFAISGVTYWRLARKPRKELK